MSHQIKPSQGSLEILGLSVTFSSVFHLGGGAPTKAAPAGATWLCSASLFLVTKKGIRERKGKLFQPGLQTSGCWGTF